MKSTFDELDIIFTWSVKIDGTHNVLGNHEVITRTQTERVRHGVDQGQSFRSSFISSVYHVRNRIKFVTLGRPVDIHSRVYFGVISFDASLFGKQTPKINISWWRHQMETFPRYWPFAGNSPVTGEFPSQRPVTRSFDVFFDLRLE